MDFGKETKDFLQPIGKSAPCQVSRLPWLLPLPPWTSPNPWARRLLPHAEKDFRTLHQLILDQGDPVPVKADEIRRRGERTSEQRLGNQHV